MRHAVRRSNLLPLAEAAGPDGTGGASSRVKPVPSRNGGCPKKPPCSRGGVVTSGLPKVRENVRLHKGWFNESLPLWSAANPGPIAFMHMDAGLCSATKTVFDLLGERIVPGPIIQFDEFFNYPDWQNGEFKAFMHLVSSNIILY